MLLIIVLVGLAAASAEIQNQSPLAKDLQDFTNLIPQDMIIQVALKYYLFDKEVKQVVAYLKEKEFTSVWNQIFAYEDTKRLIAYLESHGVPAKKYVNDVGGFFSLPVVQRNLSLNKAGEIKGKGLKSMVDEVLALLPQKDLEALFVDKMENSEAFLDLFNTIAGADFEKIDQFIKSSPEIQSLLEKLRGYGFDLRTLSVNVQMIKEFKGWTSLPSKFLDILSFPVFF